jgi:hypothetical protein
MFMPAMNKVPLAHANLEEITTTIMKELTELMVMKLTARAPMPQGDINQGVTTSDVQKDYIG